MTTEQDAPPDPLLFINDAVTTHPWTEIIVHHSETQDNNGDSWKAISLYHRSFRIDYDIFTPPVDLSLLSEEDSTEGGKFVEYNGNFYVRESVEDFYKKVNLKSSVQFPFLGFINQAVHGVQVSTADSYIAYHAGLERLNGKYVFQQGRPLTVDGAHCLGHNHTGLGVCTVGNFDVTTPSATQYFLLSCLIRRFMDKFSIPITNIHPHNAFAHKTCPGRNFNMSILLKYVSGEYTYTAGENNTQENGV